MPINWNADEGHSERREAHPDRRLNQAFWDGFAREAGVYFFRTLVAVLGAAIIGLLASNWL